MTDSITVAAFIFGLVLLIAGLIGKELKIAAVEMPALNRAQRLVVGVLGVVLMFFGLTEGRGFRLPAGGQTTPAPTAASVSASAAQINPDQPIAQPTPAGLPNLGKGLPPEFAGNIRSAKAFYGCGILLGVASNNDEQLSVCGLLPSVPQEWISKIKRVNVDCATSASDGIIVAVYTGTDYSGEKWDYSFSCPTSPAQP